MNFRKNPFNDPTEITERIPEKFFKNSRKGFMNNPWKKSRKESRGNR